MNSKIKVLIVDDSATTRSMISSHLGEEYECAQAGDGEQAWLMLQQDSSISLVFADMHMPVLNGMLLLRRMRESEVERLANMPVVIITGREDSETAKRASYNLGATDFLSKPFNRTDILCHAGSYTRRNRGITRLERNTAQEVLMELHRNPALAEIGNHAISAAQRQSGHVSVLFMQVDRIESLIETRGSELTDRIIERITIALKDSLRQDEYVAGAGRGKFIVILPATKAFKAHIIATRLQQSVRKLSFRLQNDTIGIRIAIGISSTETDETVTNYRTFGEYCIEAAHALRMSLESSSMRIVRFDETYEKKIMDEYEVPPAVEDRADDEAEVPPGLVFEKDEAAALLNDILQGDYRRIPQATLERLVAPLEKFLEHAAEARAKRVIRKAV